MLPPAPALVYISRGDNEVFVDLRPLLHQVFPRARLARFMHDALIIYRYLSASGVYVETNNGLKNREVEEVESRFRNYNDCCFVQHGISR